MDEQDHARDTTAGMEPEVTQTWLSRWEEGQTQWHSDQVHPDLVTHAGAWRRVLVPLCGATLDVAWLAERGMDVVGVELSELACQRLFEQWGRTPAVTPAAHASPPRYTRLEADRVTLLQGDLFVLHPEDTGPVDAVWDRGSLVAMSPAQRAPYLAALSRAAAGAELLLVTFEYDPTAMEGPPYSVPEAIVEDSFDDVEKLEERTRHKEGQVPMVHRVHRARIRPGA